MSNADWLLIFLFFAFSAPVVIWVIIRNNRARSQALKATNAGIKRAEGKCCSCGGTLTPGQATDGRGGLLLFRTGKSVQAIGAARCEKCGQVTLFT